MAVSYLVVKSLSTELIFWESFMHQKQRHPLFVVSLLVLIVMGLTLQPLTIPATAQSAGCTSPADCVSKMTLAEKVGQMTQVEKNAFTQSGNSVNDITTYFIGSVLSGGGEGPNGTGGTSSQWADMIDGFQGYALKTRLAIPLLYGVDAVHGNNNISGATLFPHHIGMGAMHDPALITQAEQVTRDEVLGSGARWAFAPCLCVPQDDRWGRTYEGYSEVTADVQADGAAAIVGLQGANGALGPTNILATAKHFVGDGHTTYGTGSGSYLIDQGNAQISESVLDAIDLPPYQTAIQNKVGSIMASYSSWNGVKMHANQYLLTTVLKGTGTPTTNPTTNMGFQGFVVSDWAAIDQISSDYSYDVRTAINAGVDMVMVPTNYKTFITDLTNEINAGNIPMARINDAVTRILTAKFALGLFSQPYANRTYTSNVGSAAHRAIARQAVRESLVLLKNNNSALPLSKTGTYTLVVGGDHADDLGYQMGGWSITWQGGSGATTTGTTLWGAIQQAGLASSITLNYVGTNTASSYHGDVGIVAVGESPYAEGVGDSSTLALSSTGAQEVSDVCSRVTKCVVVLFSGRPVIINTQVNQSTAFVAAWIGSTEGEGIVDDLFGDAAFSGKLTFTWPNAVTQEPINNGDGQTGLFPYGYGLTTTITSGGDGSPYTGTPYAIPGKVEAENYNVGGEGTAYHDSDTTNNGGQYRPNDGVDIEATTDTGNGYNVGWTAAGEWMKYTVNVATAGTYNFDFRVASNVTGGAFHLEVDNVNVTGSLTVPNTGGWQVWTDVVKNGVSLSAGQHVFKWVTDTAGGNYNWFNVTSASSGPTNTPTFIPPTATATVTPTATATSSGISSSAWYNVINQNSGSCVDATGRGTTNGTAIQQWACGTAQTNQEWQFIPTDSGYYRVLNRNAASGNEVWDVTGGAGATGTGVKIQLWAYGGGTNQQWMPVSLGGGYYKFVARNSGLCLDVPSASTANGVQLQQYTCNGTNAQAYQLSQQP
jgi:beta-glucosidase